MNRPKVMVKMCTSSNLVRQHKRGALGLLAMFTGRV
jgi:hypothetical protein